MKTVKHIHIALVLIAALALLLSTGCNAIQSGQPAQVPPGPNPQQPVPPGPGPQEPGPQGQVPQGQVPQGQVPPGPGPQGPLPGQPGPVPGPNPGDQGKGPIPGPNPGEQGQGPLPNPANPIPIQNNNSGQPGPQQPGCPGAPVIPYFTANPTTVQPGQPVTLSWGNVTNGPTGPMVLSTKIEPGLGEVGSGASTRDVKPTTTTTYTLTGTGCGGTATKQVTVTVTGNNTGGNPGGGNPQIPTVTVLKADLQATDMYRDEGNFLHIGIKNNSSNNGNLTFSVACTGKYYAGKNTKKDDISYSASSLTYPFNANQERWTNTNILLNKGTGYYNLTCTISAPYDTITSNNSVTKELEIPIKF